MKNFMLNIIGQLYFYRKMDLAMAYEKNFKAGIIVRYSMDGLSEKHLNM